MSVCYLFTVGQVILQVLFGSGITLSRVDLRGVVVAVVIEVVVVYVFGSVRSSRNANVSLSVRSVISALELTIFIILSQVSLRTV